MRCVAPNGSEGLTLLELVLRLEGEFRRSLEPIRVTPLQAGVLLYLQRHMDARVTDAATALRLRLPTLSVVMNDLVGKRWVTRRHSVEDRRAVCLSLTRRGEALVSAQIQRVKQLSRKLGRVLPQLFVHLRGCYTGQSVYDFRKAWSHACERVGLVGMLRHDFRRSAVCNMERAGVPRSVAMKISGHKTESIYRRYAIACESDIQDATRRLLGHNLGALPSPSVDIAHVSG